MRAWLVLVVALAGCQREVPVPSCDVMADHVLQLFTPVDDLARDVRTAFVTRCRDDAWPDSVRQCIAQTAALVEPRNCKQQLSATQAAALDRDVAAAEQRERSKHLPDECVHYEKILHEVVKCEALPKDVRDHLTKRFEEARFSWASVTDKSTLAPTCADGIYALKQAAWECPGAKNW